MKTLDELAMFFQGYAEASLGDKDKWIARAKQEISGLVKEIIGDLPKETDQTLHQARYDLMMIQIERARKAGFEL